MLKIVSPCLQSASLSSLNQFQTSTWTVDEERTESRTEPGSEPSGELSAEPMSARTIVDRFSRMPTSLIGYTTEWLSIQNSCQLMQTSRRVHEIVRQFYASRLNPLLWPGVGNEMFWYFMPAMRLDYYVPADWKGQSVLAAKGIYYPLTEKIRKKELTIDQALGYIADRERLIQLKLDSPDVTRQQKVLLRNSVFQEHIVSGRCSMRAALRMARDEWHLFHSMTLLHLFRNGELDLQDLAHISSPGLQLLHDPLAERLYPQGLISKQQILSLTDIGLISILICLPALQCKKLLIREVLAVSEEQIAYLRKTGLAEQVHSKRITLADALRQVFTTAQAISGKDEVIASSSSSACTAYPSLTTVAQRPTSYVDATNLPDLPALYSPDIATLTGAEARILLAQETPKSLRQVILSESAEYRIRWIKTFGMIIHRLPIDNLIKFLDTSSETSQSVFHDLDDGLIEPEVTGLALAFIQVYVELAQHLSSENYLRVVEPFIANVFGFIAAEAFIYDHADILDLCVKCWSQVRSSCAVTGNSIDAMRKLAGSSIEENMQNGSISHLSEIGMQAFGELLQIMELHLEEVLFNKRWPVEWTVGNWNQKDNIEETSLDYFQALCLPFANRNPEIALFFAKLEPKPD